MTVTKEFFRLGNDNRYVTITIATYSEGNNIEKEMMVRSVALYGLLEQPTSEIKFVNLNIRRKKWLNTIDDRCMMCEKKGNCVVIRFVPTSPVNNEGLILFERKSSDRSKDCNFFIESNYSEYDKVREFLKHSENRQVS